MTLPHQTECCEECEQYGKYYDTMKITDVGCLNPSCPCHSSKGNNEAVYKTSKSEVERITRAFTAVSPTVGTKDALAGWEERFEKEFPLCSVAGGKNLKDFIRSLLKSAEERGREETRPMTEGETDIAHGLDVEFAFDEGVEAGFAAGRKAMRDEVIETIKKMATLNTENGAIEFKNWLLKTLPYKR